MHRSPPLSASEKNRPVIGDVACIAKDRDQPRSGRKRKRMLRLKRLIHLQHIHPVAHDRQKALIAEAQAARSDVKRLEAPR